MNDNQIIKDINKSKKDFMEEGVLTEEQAKSIDEAMKREPVKINCRDLPLKKKTLIQILKDFSITEEQRELIVKNIMKHEMNQ